MRLNPTWSARCRRTLVGSMALIPCAAFAAGVSTVATVEAGSGGIEVDAAGNVYTSDFGAVLGDPTTAGPRVWRVTPSGEVSVFADGLEGASGSAIDSQGNFFQANIRGGYVSKIAPGGSVTKFAQDGLQSPVGIAIDADDTLYVANCGGASIQRISARASRRASSTASSSPAPMASPSAMRAISTSRTSTMAML